MNSMSEMIKYFKEIYNEEYLASVFRDIRTNELLVRWGYKEFKALPSFKGVPYARIGQNQDI